MLEQLNNNELKVSELNKIISNNKNVFTSHTGENLTTIKKMKKDEKTALIISKFDSLTFENNEENKEPPKSSKSSSKSRLPTFKVEFKKFFNPANYVDILKNYSYKEFNEEECKEFLKYHIEGFINTLEIDVIKKEIKSKDVAKIMVTYLQQYCHENPYNLIILANEDVKDNDIDVMTEDLYKKLAIYNIIELEDNYKTTICSLFNKYIDKNKNSKSNEVTKKVLKETYKKAIDFNKVMDGSDTENSDTEDHENENEGEDSYDD
jgi:hypothetical protein